MKTASKIAYIATFIAVNLLIFVKHASLVSGAGLFAFDYPCDLLIPLSTVLGIVYFRDNDTLLCFINALILVFFVAGSIAYYIFHAYWGIVFGAVDFAIVYFSAYLVLAKKV